VQLRLLHVLVHGVRLDHVRGLPVLLPSQLQKSESHYLPSHGYRDPHYAQLHFAHVPSSQSEHLQVVQYSSVYPLKTFS
jgi:hypothetical protein